jgi:hypothetical protein
LPLVREPIPQGVLKPLKLSGDGDVRIAV